MAIDLLSLTSELTKRRGDLFTQAEELAKRAKTLERLSKKMEQTSQVIVESLKNEAIKWDEYQRSLINETVISALAAIYLGSGNSDPQGKMERSWPTVIGDMLPPLIAFLNQTKQQIDEGLFEEVSLPVEFSSTPRNPWGNLLNRVLRYLSTPAYSFFQLGNLLRHREQGFRQMRRLTVGDDRVCPDCIRMAQASWQPIGSLPMPGRECQCYDRCRCRIEYR